MPTTSRGTRRVNDTRTTLLRAAWDVQLEALLKGRELYVDIAEVLTQASVVWIETAEDGAEGRIFTRGAITSIWPSTARYLDEALLFGLGAVDPAIELNVKPISNRTAQVWSTLSPDLRQSRIAEHLVSSAVLSLERSARTIRADLRFQLIARRLQFEYALLLDRAYQRRQLEFEAYLRRLSRRTGWKVDPQDFARAFLATVDGLHLQLVADKSVTMQAVHRALACSVQGIVVDEPQAQRIRPFGSERRGIGTDAILRTTQASSSTGRRSRRVTVPGFTTADLD